MKSLPKYVLVTLTCPECLLEQKLLVAPCDMYAAIGGLLNDDGNSSTQWSITVKPTDIDYFSQGE